MLSSLLELAERIMAPDGGLSPLQRVLVKSVSGDPLSKEEIVSWRRATGRVGLSGWFRSYKQKAASELWFLAGRRAFKTTFGAILTIWEATRRVVPDGQQWTIPIVAPGLRQANKIPLDMIRRKVNAVPELAPLLVGDATDSLTFSTGVEVITLPPRVGLVQGWTSPMIWCDEASNFTQEDASASDLSAVLDALRPSISTIPGARVLVTSLPGPKAGTLWEKWESRFDEGAMVFRAASADCNPSLLGSEEFQKAQRKPEYFKLYYSGEFVEVRAGLLPPALVDAAVMAGRAELPPAECAGSAAVGCDFATGGEDKPPCDCAAAVAVKVRVKDTEDEQIIVPWCRRWSVKGGQIHPVYSYMKEIAEACALYGVGCGVGDKESLAAATQFFGGKGIVYQHLTTNGQASEPIFDYFRTQLREGRLLLPDDPVLRAQLKALEERRDGGRSYEVAARKGHDDLAVAVAAAVFKVGSLPIPCEPMFEALDLYDDLDDAPASGGLGHPYRPGTGGWRKL